MEKILEETKRPREKYYKTKLTLAALVLFAVFAGLYTPILAATGIFDYATDSPQVELDTLQLDELGVDTDSLEADINRIIMNMNSAQQGTHFLLGGVAGLIFSRSTAGLTVGVIKELVDFTDYSINGKLSREHLIDTSVDLAFWFLGGFVGFYVLGFVQDAFRENNIRGPRDLTFFLGNGSWTFLRRKKVGRRVEPPQLT